MQPLSCAEQKACQLLQLKPVAQVAVSSFQATHAQQGTHTHTYYLTSLLTSLLTSGKQKLLYHFHVRDAVQDGVTGEQDEEAEREGSLLQIELETMKAVEQMQMLQQVSMCSRTPLTAPNACLGTPSV